MVIAVVPLEQERVETVAVEVAVQDAGVVPVVARAAILEMAAMVLGTQVSPHLRVPVAAVAAGEEVPTTAAAVG